MGAIGRVAEAVALDRLRAAAGHGAGTAALLVGEANTGKTAVVPLAVREREVAALVGGVGTGKTAVVPLTGREPEVAALVAEGLANRAIAGRLYLYQRTVETYVRHLLAKLRLTNRH
jgi:DNA-binding NarL/FixJ family response regulator